MKQVVQRNGRFNVEEVPAPSLPAGFVLVRVAASLLSSGTERAMARAGRKGLVEKALERPELIRRVVSQVAAEGLAETLESVRGRLNEPATVGYSAAGTVLDSRAPSLCAGDRVACAGAGFANHAEIIAVPRHLCAVVPASVPFEHAAFATIGSIALHGVRLARPELGGTVAVIGLGLVGQLAAQIALASGCRVLGIDLLDDRIDLARQAGVDAACTPDAALAVAHTLTAGTGVDIVLIAADARSNDPIRLAAELSRDRATVVAIGDVGLDVPREPFYLKELKLLVSRSYGPGRYDPRYEQEGHDYPVGYVRWTEQRNLDAFLDLIARGRVRIGPLITHRFPLTEAVAAYNLITGESGARSLGVVLVYHDNPDTARIISRTRDPAARTAGRPEASRLGVLGAGAFARAVLLPAFKDSGARFTGIVSGQGLSAKS